MFNRWTEDVAKIKDDEWGGVIGLHFGSKKTGKISIVFKDFANK